MWRNLVALMVSALALSAARRGRRRRCSASSTGSASQGVTATTIRVEVPDVDLASVRKFGVNLDHGDVRRRTTP